MCVVRALVHIPAAEVDVLIEDGVCGIDFQIVDEICAEEILVADTPAESHGGREGVAVTFGEFG